MTTGEPLPTDLLTTAEMADADRLTGAAGTSETVLMDRAGSAVAELAERRWREAPPGVVLVLCGPGNNGGDGFVAARRLRTRGVPVRLALIGPREALKGAAAEAARGWPATVEEAADASLDGVSLIIDALFGAGLSRPLDGAAAALVSRAEAGGVPVLAVDVPSGLDGNTGRPTGPVFRARDTVTFFRRKPGHLLLPGRDLCGRVTLADIGIDPAVLDAIRPAAFANEPRLWGRAYPWPTATGHKYSRGHAVVVSGGAVTGGAARLSARAALRIGAGLVTLASPADGIPANATHLTAVMLRASDGPDGLSGILSDERKNVVVLGPGLGVGEETRALIRAALAPLGEGHRAVVLDADALTTFSGDAPALAALVAAAPGPVVATPHDGEFARLFGTRETGGSRLDRARAGAAALGATLLLKGADTVVAAPDGRASVATLDAPDLATAGSGDVLAGLVGGLLAQGMPPFEAASAAVYLHADVARRFGPGLIAEDLPDELPSALAALRALLMTL